MGMQYELSSTAYYKLVLHAVKHPSQSVNGVLIGKIDSGVCKVTDAIPLFHGQLALAPMLEVALTQVDAYCISIGKTIVGYYHANERAEDYEFRPVGRKIADKIHANCPDACALLVDNSKLGTVTSASPELVVQLYTKSDRQWQEAGGSGTALSLAKPECKTVLASYVKDDRQYDIVDFSNHLDDITKDWLNPEIIDIRK